MVQEEDQVVLEVHLAVQEEDQEVLNKKEIQKSLEMNFQVVL